MKPRVLALAAFALAAACVARSETETETRRVAQAIVGGRAAALPSPVVYLGTGPGTVCTGTLIAPDLVLTAKHCVTRLVGSTYHCLEDGGATGDGGAFGVARSLDAFTVGRSGSSPNAPHVARILVDDAPSVCQGDVGMLVLDRGGFDDPVIAPVQLDFPPQVGDALVATGYGLAAGRTLPNALLARDVVVRALGPAPSLALDGGALDAVAPGFFEVGESVCHGDSGSPALTKGGAVIGVASGVDSVVPATGTAADCTGESARGIYQTLVAKRTFVLAGYAAAGRTPWFEGQPNPRNGLADVGARCLEDASCRSNACVAGVCVHGCLDTPCEDGASCEVVRDKLRCVPPPAPPPPPAAPEPPAYAAGGCSMAPARKHR